MSRCHIFRVSLLSAVKQHYSIKQRLAEQVNEIETEDLSISASLPGRMIECILNRRLLRSSSCSRKKENFYATHVSAILELPDELK